MRYFLGKDGRQLGPFDEHQVRARLAAGSSAYDDLLWHEGLPGWVPVHTVFSPLGAPPPPVAPPPMPTFLSAVTREATLEGPRLASRGQRLLAVSLDHLAAIVLGLPALVHFMITVKQLLLAPPAHVEAEHVAVFFVTTFWLAVIPQLLLFVVQAYLTTTRGQSLGKIWCRIRIIRTDGAPCGFVHGVLLRMIVMTVINQFALITALVDPLMIFRDDRRCLHDLLADTTVVEV